MDDTQQGIEPSNDSKAFVVKSLSYDVLQKRVTVQMNTKYTSESPHDYSSVIVGFDMPDGGTDVENNAREMAKTILQRAINAL